MARHLGKVWPRLVGLVALWALCCFGLAAHVGTTLAWLCASLAWLVLSWWSALIALLQHFAQAAMEAQQ